MWFVYVSRYICLVCIIHLHEYIILFIRYLFFISIYVLINIYACICAHIYLVSLSVVSYVCVCVSDLLRGCVQSWFFNTSAQPFTFHPPVYPTTRTHTPNN